jgi:hypothetical protein
MPGKYKPTCELGALTPVHDLARPLQLTVGTRAVPHLLTRGRRS